MSRTDLFAGQARDTSFREVPRHITEYLDRRIPALLKETKVPGFAIAIVRDAQVAWRHAYGVINADSQIPVTDDTIFEAGSVSKTVFAYAALKLCDRGILSLDTPLTRYSTLRPLSDPRVDSMTVRRVLAHTTGLQDFRSGDQPLAFAFDPGTRWLYSGEGYWYLQSVITELLGHTDSSRCASFEAGLQVCATDIGDFLKRQVLDPFGMTRSGYLWNNDYEQRAASGHDATGRVRPRHRTDAVAAARYAAVGGLHTTPSEYCKFLIEVLDPKPADAYRLSGAMREEMLRPQISLPDQSSWALGWQIVNAAEGPRLVHSGDNPGFKALVVASVSKRAGWMMLMNGDNAGPIFVELTRKDCPLQDLFGTD